MSALLQIEDPLAQAASTPRPLAIGIDLGTTHSVVAVMTEEGPVALSDAQGRVLFPSAIAEDKQGLLLGYEALERGGSKRFVRSAKRHMGKVQGDVWRLAGKNMGAVEVSAEILMVLKNRAEAYLGHPVAEAVITVPAYFNEPARGATRSAAEMVGLKVLRLLPEPTAAAVAYGLEHAEEGLYAVYDLGGGTFDVSILRLHQTVFQVLATSGATDLGGDDADEKILAYLRHENVSLDSFCRENPSSERYFLLAVKEAREKLSNTDTCPLILEAENFIERFVLTRGVLETLLAPLMERTLLLFEQALRDAGLQRKELKGVLMVGGMTRTPLIQQEVSRRFGVPLVTNLDPDLAVAYGAARQAKALSQGGDFLLLNVNPLSLGIETMGGLMETLIPRNAPLPAGASEVFTTHVDGQTGMVVHVYQGERELVRDNRLLASFELKLPPRPAGHVRVRVSFLLDLDGILTVDAAHEETGERHETMVRPSHGLGPDALRQFLLQSLEEAEADQRERYEVQVALDLDQAVVFVEKIIKNLASKTSEDLRLALAAAHRALVAKKGCAEALQALKSAVEPLTRGLLDEISEEIKGRHRVDRS